MSLLPVQALGLHDAGTYGGLFGSIGVGEGKTLLSFLLPSVFPLVERPLLFVPASMLEDNARERRRLSEHWRIRSDLRVQSIDILGTVQSADMLEKYRPGLLLIDEGHKTRNTRAARTRRIARYMHDYPRTIVCLFTGSSMSKSLIDFWHMLVWTLKFNAPVPLNKEEACEWAEALDHGVDPLARRRPGALLELCTEEEKRDLPPTEAARRGFQRRLVETPGVVATIGEGQKIDSTIRVRGVFYDVKPVTDVNIARLRAEWVTPDDWQLMTAAEKWAKAQEMALGLFYKWDPRPPQEWREARKEWNKFVRETISRSRTYDSELHVANACDAGKLPREKLEAWRKVRPTFTPNEVPVWFDDSALDFCARWAASSPGVVWSTHRFFAERLAKHAGLTYYGAKGFDARGRYIADETGDRSVIASIHANREGKNLQRLWHRNLIVCPPTDAVWWEQVIARTHRPGQTAPEVLVEVLLGCRENVEACWKALAFAKSIEETTGKKQKLLMARVDLPPEHVINALKTPRWVS